MERERGYFSIKTDSIKTDCVLGSFFACYLRFEYWSQKKCSCVGLLSVGLNFMSCTFLTC